ncbi:unnamed protein product [Ambrosiozyma monospora]|uniref:Unnamed protein product n=1 Tax=Ambrosiozyma monospora TaxID=43982 RepID=A0ACB5T4H5_AMBMO|nr:unnamed protein product [Ambrosiozyma monospora]
MALSQVSSSPAVVQHLISLLYGDRKYSDVTLQTFGEEYHLHKIILCRYPYFKYLLSWPVEDFENKNLSSMEKRMMSLSSS